MFSVSVVGTVYIFFKKRKEFSWDRNKSGWGKKRNTNCKGLIIWTYGGCQRGKYNSERDDYSLWKSKTDEKRFMEAINYIFSGTQATKEVVQAFSSISATTFTPEGILRYFKR